MHRYILQVDFPYTGPWGAEMSAAMQALAQSINNEPGLLWKIWTENPDTNEAGGIYPSAPCSAWALAWWTSEHLNRFSRRGPVQRRNAGPAET